MGRMTWDLARLQCHCWAGRAGWEANSDYAYDRHGRLTRTTPPTGMGGRLGLHRRLGPGYAVAAAPICHDGRRGIDVDLRTYRVPVIHQVLLPCFQDI